MKYIRKAIGPECMIETDSLEILKKIEQKLTCSNFQTIESEETDIEINGAGNE